jgi:hypothetical protein
MYRAGEFSVQTPKVSTHDWGEYEWIEYINLRGIWNDDVCSTNKPRGRERESDIVEHTDELDVV